MFKKIFKQIEDRKKYITDYAYTLGASLLLNAVLQLIIYPVINKQLGAEAMGNIVFCMSIAAILAAGIGNALCQTRLVVRNQYPVSNTDFNLILLMLVPLSSFIGTLICSKHLGVKDSIGFFFVAVLYILQLYGTAEFRLRLNYRQNFIYFLIITVGYLVGLLLLLLCNEWIYIFIIGEAAGTVFILIRGGLYKKDKPTGNFGRILKTVLPLSVSYLLIESLSNIDRIVLINILDAQAVTLYYVVSLIGKTLLMLTGPINVLMLSYISADNKTITKNQFLKSFVLYLMIGVVFYMGCLVGTPIFTALFYPELYPQLEGLNVVVNAAQVLNIVASLPIVLILSMLGTKHHMTINIVFAVIYIPLSIIMTKNGGMMGIAYASLIANLLRLIMVFLVGMAGLPENNKKETGVGI